MAKEELNYIRTRKIHESQELVGIDGDWAELRLNVIVNYELEQELLQYGEKVMVVSPQELRERMKERLEKAVWGNNANVNANDNDDDNDNDNANANDDDNDNDNANANDDDNYFL